MTSHCSHVGSFLRPAALIEVLSSSDAPSKSLKELEDSAIKDVVQMQRDIGIPILSDGEIRRYKAFLLF